MYKHLIPILLLLSAATACTRDLPMQPELAEILWPLQTMESAKQVPFKARLEGRTEGIFGHAGCPPVHYGVSFTGSGQATHLGRTEATGFLCLDAATFTFTGGTMTLTGADGSQLHGTLDGQLVPQEWPLFEVAGTYAITGGSGRFAGASGSGVLRGEVNWETDEASFELEGTVSSVGSLRSRR
ncbi:MAG: hypothetical protein ACR2H9_12925 [Longimicrobiaceae bacterium]